MPDVRREIIEAVARGELTPEQAAHRLEELEAAAPVALAHPVPPPPTSEAVGGAVRRVRIEIDLGQVSVYGDPAIAGATASGPHTAEREGDTLVIRGGESGEHGFVFGRRGLHRTFASSFLERFQVRMNPRLALALRVQAGQVRVEGVEGPIDGEVQAGSLRIDGFRAPLSLQAQAGQIRARGRLDSGVSQIRCEAGSVRLELERGSSVKVRARSAFGHVAVNGERLVFVGGGAREVQIGDGAATLDVDASVGQVRVDGER